MNAHLDAVLIPVRSHCRMIDKFRLQSSCRRHSYVTAKLQWW